MGKVQWEDQCVFYLIENVQKEERMWKFTNPLYKNKFEKKKFWFQMADELNNKFEPNIPFTYGEVVKKWNNLKSYYTAEKHLTKQVEGIQSSWKFKPSLDFLSTVEDRDVSRNYRNKRTSQNEDNSLEFQSESVSSAVSENGTLEEHLAFDTLATSSNNENKLSFEAVEEIKEEISSRSSEDSAPFPISMFSNDESPKTHSTPAVSVHCKKKRKMASQSESVSSNEISNNLTQVTKVTEKKETENAAFGAFIAAEMDKLAPELQIAAKKQIFGVIMDLQIEELKRPTK